MTSSLFFKNSLPSTAALEEAPIVQLVSHLLLKAQQHRASDLHLEPFAHAVRVRFRIDGVLQEMQQLPKKLQEAIVSRLKIMSTSMNIAEKRIPQEGRFPFQQGSQSFDVRVSIMPTVHGESVVLRLLDRASLILGLADLGLEKEDQTTFKNLIHQPNGLLLVTGPTGSGKTTTLYACLQELNHADCKIITVEDPIEYDLPGVNQVQVQDKIGRTFPNVLRAMLRQATNKIMVGEIRDSETARIAINASLTGHLIFSTLHTNDAPSTVARLEDIGIPRFLIASSLRAIIAQRLVRRLCAHCKISTTFTEYEKKILHLPDQLSSSCTPMKATGCSKCDGKGFQGRLGIFEILKINDSLRHEIHHQKSTSSLRAQARMHGMKTLREDGLNKILAGLTTVEEVVRQAKMHISNG